MQVHPVAPCRPSIRSGRAIRRTECSLPAKSWARRFVAYSPLGRGFLAGNFRRLAELPENDNRRNQPRFQDGAAARNAAWQAADRSVAAELGATAAQVAIAWVLAAFAARRHHSGHEDPGPSA